MPTLGELRDLLDGWYPPDHADDWDAVGLTCGDPGADVAKVLLAVDPVRAVAVEAVSWGAQLLVTHHPLYLRGTSTVAADTPKGGVVHGLLAAGCGLFTAHTNADSPTRGVSESLALALGLTDVVPLDPDDGPPATRGSGRLGRLPAPESLADFAARVAQALPAVASGVRVAGERDQQVRTVALCGGAGDFLLEKARASGADVYLTSDLRHHPASESRETGGMALVDVAHWAAEWTWLPVLAERLRAALGDSVEVHVSTVPTDPWTFHLDSSEGRP